VPDRRAPAETPQRIQRFIRQEIIDNGNLGRAVLPSRRDIARRLIGIDRTAGHPATLLQVEHGGRASGLAVV
jgi:hypothetical protein